MDRHTCPNWPTDSDLVGCGYVFRAEPDSDG